MKRVFVLLLVLMPLSVFCGDFRDAEWGMSQSDILRLEGKPVDQNDELIAYSRDVAGLSSIVFYYFVNDTLVSGKYLTTEKYTNKNEYITKYKKLKVLLRTKYGMPNFDKNIWHNDLYKDDKEDWGMAISVGHLSSIAYWISDETEIYLGLVGNNYRLQLSIEYHSVEHKELRESAQKKKDLGGL